MAEADGLEACKNNWPSQEGYKGHRCIAHQVPKEWIVIEAAQLLGVDLEQLFESTSRGEPDDANVDG
jgi:hypothetical protein